MFGYIDSFLSDPKGMLIMLLLALPGRLLAISAHEFGHAWVADRCGDHTARMLGRLTLNPMKHLDVIGTLMMVLVGFGWAKPVPVNPRNFRNYRRDDLMVSVAGITMNLILFVLGCVLLYTILGAALARAGSQTPYAADYFIDTVNGAKSLIIKSGTGYSYLPVSDMARYAPYMSEWIVSPVFGTLAGYLTQMLMYFVITNLVLAVFNLIPMPPLDGYHVLNDLVLKKDLFASARMTRIFSIVMLFLMIRGYIGTLIGYVQTFAFDRIGLLAEAVYRSLGIF